METNFKIAKFVKNDNSFEKTGYDEYQISYLRGTKIHELRLKLGYYYLNFTNSLKTK